MPGRGQREPRARDRRDRVDPHAVALEFLRGDQRQRGDRRPWPRRSWPGRRWAVSRPDARRRVDHRGVRLLTGLRARLPVVGGMAQHREVALQVHGDAPRPTPPPPWPAMNESRRMPALLTTTSSRPNSLDRLVDQRLPRRPTSATLSVFATARPPAAAISSTTSCAGPRVGAAAVVRAAEVVDDDARALAREQQRVLAADAAAGAGDHGDPAVKCTHGFAISSLVSRCQSVISASPSVMTRCRRRAVSNAYVVRRWSARCPDRACRCPRLAAPAWRSAPQAASAATTSAPASFGEHRPGRERHACTSRGR